MKNIYEVLRLKEQQAEQLETEIAALRLAIRILEDTEPPAKVTDFSNHLASAIQETTAAAGVNSSKRFP